MNFERYEYWRDRSTALKSQLQQAQERIAELEEAKGTETECIDLHKEAGRANAEKYKIQAENAALRADNVGLIKELETMLTYDSISWLHPHIEHLILFNRPGAALLKELEALRAVRSAAEEIVKYEHTNLKKLKDALATTKGAD